jgi:CBS-domain-containing membrane protein
MTIAQAQAAPVLTLEAVRAADLMSASPMSVVAEATVPEVTAALTARGLPAAPVIDERGRPVGVVSRGDLLVHERERLRAVSAGAGGPSRAADVMTPVVFSVTPDTPAEKVVEQILNFNVHQVFVVDDNQVLVGVVTVLDVLRRLRPGAPP